MENLEAFNRKFFLLINADEHTSSLMLCLGKFLAKDTLYILVLLLAALWLWGGDARRRLALKSIISAIVALIIGAAISAVWFHPRPFAVNLGHAFMPHSADASFPSDHTTIFFAIGFCLLAAAETRLLGWAVLVAGALAGWARVYMGIHFPLDILGGVIVGYMGFWGVSRAWGKYATTIESCPVHLYRKLCAPLITRGWIKP